MKTNETIITRRIIQMEHNNWHDFIGGSWQYELNVRDFLQKHYTEYTGESDFLSEATPRTKNLMSKLQALFAEERKRGGVLDVDTTTASSLLNYKPGYIDKDNEIIVGIQTNRPLKRGVNPFGGMRMVRQACEAYGYKLHPRHSGKHQLQRNYKRDERGEIRAFFR